MRTPTPNKLLSLVILMVCAAILPGQAAQPAPGKSSPPLLPGLLPAGEETLESRMMGVWLLDKAATPGTPSGIGTRRRTFTPGKWEIIQRDPKTGNVIFHHGGSYRLNGDILEQKVEFAGKSTASYIGRTNKFKITVENGVYTQIAIGNQFSEVWIRANDA